MVRKSKRLIENKVSEEPMPFRVFIGSNSQYPHEREHITEILKNMSEYYKKQDEWCFVFTNIILKRIEIDLLVVKKDAVIVIDLKNITGNLSVDTEKNEWIHEENNVKKEVKHNNRTPQEQISNNQFIVNGLMKLYHKQKEKNFEWDEIRSMVRGFVIVRQSAIVKKKLHSHWKYWFNVFPSEDTFRNISISTSPKELHIQEDILDFISKQSKYEIVELENHENYDLWYLGNNQPDKSTSYTVQPSKGRYLDFPVLTKAFSSESLHEIKRAMDTIEHLGITGYEGDLINLKSSNDPQIRNYCLDSAIQFIQPDEITPFLLEFIDDEYLYIRKKVFELLGQLGDSSANPKLLEILSKTNSYDVLEEILKVFEVIGDEKCLNPLLNLNENVERFKESYLEHWGYSDDSKARIEKLWEYEKENILSRIIKIMGTIGSTKAVPFLTKHLDVDSHSISNAVYDSLGRIGGKEAKTLLLKYLKDPPDYIGSQGILRAISYMDDPSICIDLIPYLEKTKGKEDNEYTDRWFISQLINIFAEYNHPETYEPLFNYLKASLKYRHQYNIRDNISKILSSIDNEKFENDILEVLSHTSDEIVKMSVCRILLNAGTRKSIPALLDLMHKAEINEITAGTATWSLVSVLDQHGGYNEIKKPIYELLKSDNEEDRTNALSVIVQMEKENVDIMAQYVNDRSPMVVRAAIVGFQYCGNKSAIPYLINLLPCDENDYYVIRALEHLANDNVGKNYCIENDFEIPQYLLDLLYRDIPEDYFFDKLLILSHYWGVKVIPILEEVYPKLHRGHVYLIVEMCSKIFDEACIPLLEKVAAEDGMSNIPAKNLIDKIKSR